MADGHSKSAPIVLQPKRHSHNYIDLTGQRFGSLVVIVAFGRYRRETVWECQCDCGKVAHAVASKLRTGRKRSCGCLQLATFAAGNPTHGLSNSREYKIWKSMLRRCIAKTGRHYRHYGSRGITVCQRWRQFVAFYADMGPRPSPKHSIERKNNDVGYSPENCVWATRTEQMRNTRNSRTIECYGQTRTLAEWSEVLGIHYGTLRNRLRTLTAEQAFSRPLRKPVPPTA
jgi:hypothetical protein